MYLWDAIEPPLPPGTYKLTATAEARFADTPAPERIDNDRFFIVDAPRFALPPNEVAGMVPPHNAHGAFYLSLPHVVLGRRTLPWERTFDATRPGTPWMALLVFDEDECTILDQVPLSDVVPPHVFNRLGRPSGVLCDTVEVDESLLQDVMPSVQEVRLLTHVRQVNVDDRELAAGDSDGWFAIVVANRLPAPGRTHVACLVSIEERTDVVPDEPPPVAPEEAGGVGGVGGVFEEVRSAALERPRRRPGARSVDVLGSFREIEAERASTGASLVLDPSVNVVGHAGLGGKGGLGPIIVLQNKVRLVLLHRWRFDDDGSGTFKDLMQNLDVGMIGKVADSGRPVVTDTGHLTLTLHSRVGVDETAWYRGPLVPHQLSRDEHGPYHSADAARRVAPETGAEDVSYAAAFEVGRLLAAADQRLAVELMRWRRGAYQTSAQSDLMQGVTERLPDMLPGALAATLPKAMVPVLAAGVIDRVTQEIGPVADPYRTDLVVRAPGLDPDLVQAAWRLPTREAAVRLLNAEAPGVVVDAVERVEREERFASIDEAARDRDGIDRLDGGRLDDIGGGL
jgi:hypothetical protein